LPLQHLDATRLAPGLPYAQHRPLGVPKNGYFISAYMDIWGQCRPRVVRSEPLGCRAARWFCSLLIPYVEGGNACTLKVEDVRVVVRPDATGSGLHD